MPNESVAKRPHASPRANLSTSFFLNLSDICELNHFTWCWYSRGSKQRKNHPAWTEILMLSKNTINLGGGGAPGFQSHSKKARSQKEPIGLRIGRTMIDMFGQSVEHWDIQRFSVRSCRTFLTSSITAGDIVADVAKIGHGLRCKCQMWPISRYLVRKEPHCKIQWASSMTMLIRCSLNILSWNNFSKPPLGCISSSGLTIMMW